MKEYALPTAGTKGDLAKYQNAMLYIVGYYRRLARRHKSSTCLGREQLVKRQNLIWANGVF